MDTALLLIDVQPGFLDAMHGEPEPLLRRLERLLRFADMMSMPVIATVERPLEAKGALHERLRVADVFEKWMFSALRETPIRDALSATGCRRVAVAGAETDVCVLQTVLDLREAGYEVVLLTDCVFSSEPDPRAALDRMAAAGATPATFKTFCYEVLETADRTAWPDPGFAGPEDL